MTDSDNTAKSTDATHSVTTDLTNYPVLPLRDIVVFPYMIVPLFVGREKSVRALEEVMNKDKQIILVTQREANEENPLADDLHNIGTLGTVLQLLKLPDGSIKVLVEGHHRVEVSNVKDNGEFLEADFKDISVETGEQDVELEALSRTTLKQFEQYIKLNKKIPSEVLVSFGQIEDAGKLADSIASHLVISIASKQELLENIEVSKRLARISEMMRDEIDVMQVEKRIRNRVKRQMEKSQRDYYLNEQIKAIQKELGDGDDGGNEIAELQERAEKTKLSKEAREKIAAEIKKLKSMSPASAEATVVRNYIDTLLSLPWKQKSRVKTNIVKAREILDEDHFGLDKVKDRIIEYLAVQQRMKKIKGPILCLVGPPGVGKTSLGKSIAKATGRKFTRFALGGIRDESEIRGHRRTYIGSMPGKVIQSLKKAATCNPLMLLDEIDKIGADWRGDPSSALLEVLDPEQNSTFQDHYIEVDFDLSDIMFITTANTLNMPQPLLDRMEIIRISGYTEDEKVEIAKRHLIQKQMTVNGLKKDEFSITDAAIRFIIQHYTRESGVRNIERELSKLARKVITAIVKGDITKAVIDEKTVAKYLGVPRFRHGETEAEDMVGITTGLAWTEVGGEMLNIEAVTFPGKGKVSSTGKLGDVMKESIQAAEYFIKSRASILGISHDSLSKNDIHVHIPEGATPKDGPSAGIAMVTSMVSALTGNPVRHDVAMTGELTLRGRVLPIGGLKEKLLAAVRAGIKTAIIPKDNVKDLADVPENVRNSITICPVQMIDEVLVHALVEKPIALKISDDSIQPNLRSDDDGDAIITH